ncbi:aspartyl/asparaginyl beta-hydroxylase [Salinisphaera shabanensis T35B1]
MIPITFRASLFQKGNLMATQADQSGDKRRKLVKRFGKKLFRGTLLEFLSKQSKIPDQPVLDNALFPWAEELRVQWPEIRDELEALLEHRAALPSFQEISPDQARISSDARWKTFMLYGFGTRMDFGCEMCPKTAAALEKLPNISNAFFSILAPGKHIPRHRGVTKGLVRCHLGLRVPKGPERCLIEIDDQPMRWGEGEMFFFDDTYPHEVWNETSEERAVLLFDIERPMGPAGRAVSRAMISVLRRTAYFKDAMRNQRAWEQRYRETVLAGQGH